MIKLSLNISMPQAQAKNKPEPPDSYDLYQKVCDYILCVETGTGSEYHWQYLKHLYEKITSSNNLTKAKKQILKKLEPIILKHYSYDSGDSVDIDADKMFKYTE